MRGAAHPNAARLMIDFLVSHEGQVALAEVG
jgi:ABC-type Fe3+ transport system substrate-binding protein